MQLKMNDETERLLKLYNECVSELKTIGIDVTEPFVGSIDIKIASRNNKRYGCCKQEKTDKNFCKKVRKGRRIVMECDKFNKHHIEISKWVMELNEDIIKNTIIHELIHCMPYCNNHGEHFKKYAKIINEKLGYNISRLGNKELDYKASNLDYEENKPKYRYEIICTGCGQKVLRQRVNKNFATKYRCGKCGGKFKILKNVEF